MNEGSDGRIWAFHYRPDQPPISLPIDAGPGDPNPCGEGGWLWVHYDLVHAQASTTMRRLHRLQEFAAATLTSTDETPRMIVRNDVVAGVLPAFRSDIADEYELCSWHFALHPDLLVTARRAPTRSLFRPWKAACDGEALACPSGLVDRALAEFARGARAATERLANELDEVEDSLLLTGSRSDLDVARRTLGSVRRRAVTIKRALVPVERVIEHVADELPPWIAPDAHDVAHREIRAATDDLAALQDRAHTLQDELSARQAEEVNRRLYVVSIVTTVFVPASFIVGFFGMNTGGMFLAQSPFGTTLAAVLCAGAIVCTLMTLRRLLLL